jgi:ATP-dependent protease HslVU (ClpYQ) peptidase subunit
MTVIAAYKDKTHFWIGSDSCGFWNNSKADYGSKLIKKENYIIGFAGSDKIRDILKEEKSIPKTINSIEDIRDLRDLLKITLIEEYGCSDSACNGELLSHPVDLLIATRIGLYNLEGTYQLLKYKDNYGAIGIGEEFAVGSLYTSKTNKEEDGKKAVTLAVKSAIKHCTEAAGKVYTQSIKLRG